MNDPLIELCHSAANSLEDAAILLVQQIKAHQKLLALATTPPLPGLGQSADSAVAPAECATCRARADLATADSAPPACRSGNCITVQHDGKVYYKGRWYYSEALVGRAGVVVTIAKLFTDGDLRLEGGDGICEFSILASPVPAAESAPTAEEIAAYRALPWPEWTRDCPQYERCRKALASAGASAQSATALARSLGCTCPPEIAAAPHICPGQVAQAGATLRQFAADDPRTPVQILAAQLYPRVAQLCQTDASPLRNNQMAATELQLIRSLHAIHVADGCQHTCLEFEHAIRKALVQEPTR